MQPKEVWFMLVVIAKRSIREKLVKRLYEFEAAMINQTLVKGSAKEGLLRTLGFGEETSKVMLSGFIREQHVESVFHVLETEYHFDKPNSGFAFTIPVEEISY